jgi:DNA-binding response OmpR family regulator
MALILIVEDAPDIADVIADVISTELRHQARIVGTVAQALIAVRSEQPNAILLDIKLPDASGTVGLDRLRRLLPTVPIIMLTGNADEALARDALRRGAFDYIASRSISRGSSGW